MAGKTTLANNFAKPFFTEDNKRSIGVIFHVGNFELDTKNGPLQCKFQIWVVNSGDEFKNIRTMYYRQSSGALLVFDLTNHVSFEHVPIWFNEIRENLGSELPILLVGNKNDLAKKRIVFRYKIDYFIQSYNLNYIEVSAKTGDGVEECLFAFFSMMIETEEKKNDFTTGS